MTTTNTHAGRRILIAGGPRVGKTTLADRLAAEAGIEARHTDDLIGTFDWSQASAEVATWLDEPGPWVVEGVASVRALRKWILAHPDGMPCDIVYWSTAARTALTKGQEAMMKGCATVWVGIQEVVRARGVDVRRF